MRVLLVEDDPGLAAIIKTGFAEHGVHVLKGIPDTWRIYSVER